MSHTKDELLYLAKLAEQAERYDGKHPPKNIFSKTPHFMGVYLHNQILENSCLTMAYRNG